MVQAEERDERKRAKRREKKKEKKRKQGQEKAEAKEKAQQLKESQRGQRPLRIGSPRQASPAGTAGGEQEGVHGVRHGSESERSSSLDVDRATTEASLGSPGGRGLRHEATELSPPGSARQSPRAEKGAHNRGADPRRPATPAEAVGPETLEPHERMSHGGRMGTLRALGRSESTPNIPQRHQRYDIAQPSNSIDWPYSTVH